MLVSTRAFEFWLLTRFIVEPLHQWLQRGRDLGSVSINEDRVAPIGISYEYRDLPAIKASSLRGGDFRG